jgi:hypothetical protein
MEYPLERIIFLFILVITTYYNITLGLLVCFVIIVIYFSQEKELVEGYTINNNNYNDNDNDCDLVKIPNVQVMTTTDYTAIMVEPRKHRALEFVMKNFTENLSNNWNFIIYHLFRYGLSVKPIF